MTDEETRSHELRSRLDALDAHFEKLHQQRRREMRYITAWWACWNALAIVNIFTWHNPTIGDLCLYANCVLIAKSLYDAWSMATGRYPPKPPGMR